MPAVRTSTRYHALSAAGVAFLALAPPMPASSAEAPVCVRATQVEIAARFDAWNASLGSGRLEDVLEHYSDDAVLLPDFSDRPRRGQQEIREYFRDFLRRHPDSTVTMRSIMTGCNVASDVGTFVYRVTGRRKGTRMLLGGRFSTVYEYRDGRWLIIQQHMSVMPRESRR